MDKKNKLIRNQIHLNNVSLHHIFNLGFRYSPYDECYICIVPLIFYKKKPVILCKLKYKKLDNIILYDIIRPNSDPVAFYYDRKYGNAKKYNAYINYKLQKKLKAMGLINKHK